MQPAFKNLAILLAVSLLLVPQQSPASGAPSDEATAIPDLIPNPFRREGPPLWVGEKRAFDETGAFRMELFNEDFRHQDWDRELFALPAGSCYEFGPTYVSYIESVPFSYLYQIAHDAPRILHGVVIARQSGFLSGAPGTLVRVRRLQEIRSAEPGPDFLFFLHLGEVQVGPRRICLNDPTLSPLPAVGDEIIVFARDAENDLGELVRATTMEAYLTIKGEEVYLPRRMSQESAPYRRRKADVLQVFEKARP